MNGDKAGQPQFVRLVRGRIKLAEVTPEDPRLLEVVELYLAMADELSTHMVKEERILFPMIRQLEQGGDHPVFLGQQIGSVAHPIRHS
jgi:regulator of cell morphogenesis and NO signaling